MSTFVFLFVCVQACLLQNVYSQCAGLNAIGFNYALAEPYAAGLGCGAGLAAPLAPLAVGSAYGGAGIGEVAVAGELPVAGATLVGGQVPILGVVEFGGLVPAAGAISITGSCACGCGYDAGPYYY